MISAAPFERPRTEEGPDARPRRLYGRRKGRKLSARQQDLLACALPRHAVPEGDAPLRLATLFPQACGRFALEVGFGGGEHLAALARLRPDWGFLGCEPYLNGVVKLLAKIEESGLANIRIHHGDARELLQRLPPASLDAAYVLFPDPWPKRRHWKRRFMAPDTLSALARILCPGSELRVATDSGPYARFALERALANRAFRWLAASARDWRVRPEGAPETRYEAKARRAGRPVYYLRFKRAQGGP